MAKAKNVRGPFGFAEKLVTGIVVAYTIVFALLYWYTGVSDLRAAQTVVFWCMLPLPVVYLLLPIWLAGRKDGWGPLDKELDTPDTPIVQGQPHSERH